jgi:hypothetical protein
MIVMKTMIKTFLFIYLFFVLSNTILAQVQQKASETNLNQTVDSKTVTSNAAGEKSKVSDTAIIINKEMIAMYKRYMERTNSMDYGNYAINFRELSYADNATIRKAWDVYLGLEAPDSLMLASNQIIHIEGQNTLKAIVFPLHLPADMQSAPIQNLAATKEIVTDTVTKGHLNKPAAEHQKLEISFADE